MDTYTPRTALDVAKERGERMKAIQSVRGTSGTAINYLGRRVGLEEFVRSSVSCVETGLMMEMRDETHQHSFHYG